MKVVVIGGGAAGFFGAITCAETFPEARVTIIEKTGKLLSKVRVSGGGRCNVTHACFEPKPLSGYYPRGSKELIGAFHRFQPADTVRWFESKGVTLKTEEDGRMFPVTDNSETIAGCLLDTAESLGIRIKLNTNVRRIVKNNEGAFELILDTGTIPADRVLIAAGGSPKADSYSWIAGLGHTIEPPVPSLFTFNIPDKELHTLAGLSVSDALIKIGQSKLESRGPLLITHWGMSGPAILRASAWGAKLLYEKGYDFTFTVNWLPAFSDQEMSDELGDIKQRESRKLCLGFSPLPLPLRLWKYLAVRSGMQESMRWADVPGKTLNRLKETLLRGEFQVKGKTTFKEEFVTCGGIKLSEVDFKTMESRVCKGLFFAGEVLDIDGITGGFNFQNAWTTGWIAGKSLLDGA